MSAWALQQAVYGALIADDDVAALLDGRVFDAPPRDAAMPYAVIGDVVESDWSTKTDNGLSLVFTLHLWSRGHGYREAKLAAAALRAALDGAALALSGATLIDLRFDSATYARQGDGVTRRADLKFRALMELGDDT